VAVIWNCVCTRVIACTVKKAREYNWKISGIRLVTFRLDVNLKDTLIRERERETVLGNVEDLV
jgi:hypothetical protein